MFNLSLRSYKPYFGLLHSIEKPLAGLGLAVGLLVSGLSYPSQGAEAPTVARESRVTEATALAGASNRRPLADGVYLYGQSPQPDQLGSAYLVFQVNNSRVVGAFYMPASSFDCFYGEVEESQLALTVVDSYEQTRYPYGIALESGSSVAAVGNGQVNPVSLQGYHTISNLSETDENILSVCQSNYQEQI